MDWQLQTLPDTAATAYDGGIEANCLDQQLLDFNFALLSSISPSLTNTNNSVAVPAPSSPPTNLDYDFFVGDLTQQHQHPPCHPVPVSSSAINLDYGFSGNTLFSSSSATINLDWIDIGDSALVPQYPNFLPHLPPVPASPPSTPAVDSQLIASVDNVSKKRKRRDEVDPANVIHYARPRKAPERADNDLHRIPSLHISDGSASTKLLHCGGKCLLWIYSCTT
ncbi:hypothetical protein DFH09DRAFT_1311403 [Mycena vulgaris]|nr:hypothetical protein DFH09DRAFT_1311403 [Mycena vulgaris]